MEALLAKLVVLLGSLGDDEALAPGVPQSGGGTGAWRSRVFGGRGGLGGGGWLKFKLAGVCWQLLKLAVAGWQPLKLAGMGWNPLILAGVGWQPWKRGLPSAGC